MTSNWTSLFVAGSLLFVTTQIAAEEHAVLGQGNVSCGSWLNDRKGEDAASSRIAWVLGYVTGFNQYGSKPEGDVSGAAHFRLSPIPDVLRVAPLGDQSG
jgi:hypothetical protein